MAYTTTSLPAYANNPMTRQTPFNPGAGWTQTGPYSFQGTGQSLTSASQNGGPGSRMLGPNNTPGFTPGGAPGGIGSGGFLGGGGGGMDMAGLLKQQQDQNAEARAKNEQNWFMARDRLTGVEDKYNANPIVKETQGLTSQFLANPEAINDRIQALMQNRAANLINAQGAAQARQGAGVLAAGGQLDTGSIAAMQERLGGEQQANLANSSNQLEIQRANQRNQDIMNALGAGRAQGGMDTGVSMDVARTLIGNLPQYRPDDLSGMIAALGQYNAGQGIAAAGGAQAAGTGAYAPGGVLNESQRNAQLQHDLLDEWGTRNARTGQPNASVTAGQNWQMPPQVSSGGRGPTVPGGAGTTVPPAGGTVPPTGGGGDNNWIPSENPNATGWTPPREPVNPAPESPSRKYLREHGINPDGLNDAEVGAKVESISRNEQAAGKTPSVGLPPPPYNGPDWSSFMNPTNWNGGIMNLGGNKNNNIMTGSY